MSPLISVAFIVACCHTAATVSAAFTWPSNSPVSYATPLSRSPSSSTYAPPFAALSSLVPNQTTTTWASVASPTDSAVKYGNYAWSAQWATLSSNVTTPPFTTTAAATPIASSELIKPPPLPFAIGYDNDYHYPEHFISGFASSAVQGEGASMNEGRGPSLAEKLFNGSSISSLSYYLYKQDIARMAAAGVQTYAFTISWSRILPFAVPGSPVNQQGIDHYNDLIDTLIKYGITPIVTLNHFDTPLYYYTKTSFSGWDHPEFVEGFVNYAQIVLSHYADRVSHWISFNEPTVDAIGFNNWQSSYNVNIAHARVVHWYREVLKGTGKWTIKLSLQKGFTLPLNATNASDVQAAERELDFTIAQFANPLFLGQPVPESLSSALGNKTPTYTDAELEYLNGTCDLFSLNFYSAEYVTAPPGGFDACLSNSSSALYPKCVLGLTVRNGWDVGVPSNAGRMLGVAEFRPFFSYVWSRWPSPGGIIVPEFGWAPFEASAMTTSQQQADLMASIWYQSMLNEMLKSTYEDGVPFVGALGWSFLDNWEFGEYADKYGVVGWNATTLQRYYKRTIFDFVDFASAREAA
ncbi:hypothetical protein PV11_09539 [Exophiala sideris]|uniref:Beta-glucosidase n=1 Tax=Exophiala sideris TaxID=1016849 RepID=A0A0D1YS30_9EURO|nr:hypothetical protein PV11_09539 [Exophiala sideris]